MTDQHTAPETEPDVLVDVERLIGELQAHHGAEVRDKTSQLLEGIDAIHRAGLTHLIDVVRGMGGDAFINRLIADPAIRMLLMSYDLVPVDRRLMAEEAMDAVRGHLHGHGVDIEILEVVGGVVYVRLHGLAAGAITLEAVVRDVEEALREGFVGFQELVTKERSQAGAATISMGSLRRANRPVYRDALDATALADGEMRAVDVDGTSILIVHMGAEFYAVANHCGDSPLPLEFSALTGPELTCSWHGCRYDVRTGARLDVGGERIRVYPVKVDEGRVRIAVDVEAMPGRA
ncbi:MAG TPA: Rieske 2Fe-2S domain-containing protein [Vicinamibacterales bacterium]|nr:Rieske 2Fe-2S domain-containing protein [Vicinamibacterales bacterium]